MKKVFSFGFLLMALTGCLKQKYPMGNTSLQNQTIQGAIVLRDWHGKALEKPQGHVLAQFVQPSTKAFALKAGLKLPALARASGTEKVTTQCEVIHEPKSTNHPIATGDSKDVTVNMGKVAFGTSANNLVSLTEGENHLYSLNLQPNFESGIYLASVEGNTQTPGFAIKMSMPERMGQVIVAGQDFETSATAFRKNEPLSLSWEAPKGEFDLKTNQMELELISETDKEVVSVICGAMEKDLMTSSSTVTWEIPSNYLQALDATPNGLAILKRGQWMRASSPEIGVVSFEGVRIYATPALISE